MEKGTHICIARHKSTSTPLYYSGRAGDFWLTSSLAEAFRDSAGYMKMTAERLNKMSALHGYTLEAVPFK